MAENTPNLGLVKQAGSENVNVGLLNLNFDKLDEHPGIKVVTSTTRPSTPYANQMIFESDTSRLLIWDGAGWREYYNGVWHFAHRRRPGNQSFPASTWTAVSWSVDGNMSGMTSSISYNGTDRNFTVSVPGIYMVTTRIAVTSSSTTASVIFRLNTSDGRFDNLRDVKYFNSISSSGVLLLDVTGLGYLAAGATITADVNPNAACELFDYANGNIIQIAKVG